MPSNLRQCCLIFTFASVLLVLSTPLSAVTIHFQYGDSPGEGFYDPTLGAERRAAWEYAVSTWSSRLNANIPIVIKASFDNLGTGDSVVLGRAGANFIHRDFPGAPKARTWYDDPLANQYRGVNIVPSEPDIEAIFNNQVDTLNAMGTATFYYGLDDQVPPNRVSFIRLAMHEICHGLGFATVIKSSDGSMPDGIPSIYDRYLIHYDGLSWKFLSALSTSERYAAITSEELYFNGGKTQETYGDVPPVFAPSQPYPGSSVSHFDYNKFNPSELMEPVLYGTHLNPGLADEVLEDIGWDVVPLPVVAFKSRRPSPFDKDDSVVEGNSAHPFVSLSSAALADTYVSFSVSGSNGAVEGMDYVVETLSPLYIPAGSTGNSIAIRALSTPEDSTGKEVRVTLQSSSGAEIPRVGNSIGITIEDSLKTAVDDWMNYQ